MPPKRTSKRRDAIQIIGLALLYFLAGRLGVALDNSSTFATLIWPASGLALAALWFFGLRLWPGVALGAVATNLSIGVPLASAAGIAAGSCLEAVLAVYLLRRARFDPSLSRLKDVLALVLLAAAGATALSTSVGVFSLWAGGLAQARDLLLLWRSWWLGDALGDLIIAPVLMVGATRAWPRLTGWRWAELAAVVVAIAGVSLVVFHDLLAQTQIGLLRRAYFLFPFLSWAAIRFRQPGAVLSIFLVSIFAVSGTLLGRGPFASGSLDQGLLLFDSFVGILALTALALGAAIAERDRAMQEAQARAASARFLAEAGRLLASSLDYQTTLHNLARLSVPVLADLCTVHVLEADGNLRQVAEAARDPWKELLLRRLRTQPVSPERPTLTNQVLASGEARLVSDLEAAELARLLAGDDDAGVVRNLSPRSALAVPLLARGKPVGVVTLAMAESGRTPTREHLALAEELGRRAGLAVDSARLYEAAQAAVRARDEFLSIASHELRTPLTTLKLQLSRLLRLAEPRGGPGPGTEALSAKLGIVDRQLDRLAGLVGNLLDVSRAFSGRLLLEPEETDLRSVVEEVAARFRDQAAAAGSGLAVEPVDQCIGYWDRLRLEQIVTNLISNATKYGAGRPIEVHLRAEGGLAVLVVEDHGIGISAADQARIFEPFERAVSPRHFGGLGLGLWIVRQIVEAMGGSISVMSEPGRGSRFTVVLPKVPPAATERRPSAEAGEPAVH